MISVRGGVSGIAGTEEPVDKSVILGNLHIKAGSPEYENTDRILYLKWNWSIIGAGHRTASIGDTAHKFQIKGNVTIDTYENVWSWEKGSALPYNISEIYGAYGGEVGGNVVINAHGSHVGGIYGASDSDVHGAITITATDVELKSREYGTKYDDGYVFGLWCNNENTPATAKDPVTININGGDVALVMATDQTTVPAGSSINVTGKPNIRIGLRGTQATKPSSDFPVANIDGCTATIPYIKMMSQVNVTNHSDVTAHIMSSDAGLMVEKGSKLTTDNGQVWIWGNAVIDGTWEQKHSQTANYNDIFIQGTTEIGAGGHLINHGTSNLKENVTNNGVMALMQWAFLQNGYQANNGELRLPAVVNNYNAASIPLKIKGLASGTTTVNTVAPEDWTKLKKPQLGDNYIVALRDGDAPAQSVFLLGNEDALREDWFLKRKDDLDDPSNYYMWQVATGISVTFDKNGGDTEADPNRMLQEQNPNGNHFELPSVQPTREGYEFTGWNTKADGTGAAFTAETEVKQSLTVYAQWTRKQIEKEDTISVTVKKVWKLNDGGKATDSVTVALYKNGNMDRTAVLNDANRWTYTWDDLSAKDAWTVEEPEVPNGFKAVVERKGSVFTITNDDIRVDVPQTGDKSHWLLWTVLLLASGLGITQCVRKGKGKIEQ